MWKNCQIQISSETKLLRNGWTDICEILCAYRVGLTIGELLFFIPLNDRSDPPRIFIFFDKIYIFILL